jgi:hypothetical protein
VKRKRDHRRLPTTRQVAYHCRQWDTLNKQLSLFVSTNYEYFGGKSEFEKMVRAAKEHAK